MKVTETEQVFRGSTAMYTENSKKQEIRFSRVALLVMIDLFKKKKKLIAETLKRLWVRTSCDFLLVSHIRIKMSQWSFTLTDSRTDQFSQNLLFHLRYFRWELKIRTHRNLQYSREQEKVRWKLVEENIQGRERLTDDRQHASLVEDRWSNSNWAARAQPLEIVRPVADLTASLSNRVVSIFITELLLNFCVLFIPYLFLPLYFWTQRLITGLAKIITITNHILPTGV